MRKALVNARSDNPDSLTSCWRDRAECKGNSVTGIVGSVNYSLGQLPEPYRTQYQNAREEGRVIYTILSYATPIAWVLSDGREIKPPVRYSVTTSKHQGRLY